MSDRFAVMGNPIAHSLSPFIHQRFAEQLGISLSYEKILVAEANFESEVSEFFRQGGKGLNITLPFKQRAFAMSDLVSLGCKEAKAANTLWFSAEKLNADNTDGIGLIRDLSSYCELRRKQVLLLGAGGAARGIIGPLLTAGVAELVVVNRTEEKAKDLKKDFTQIKACPLSELKTAYDLIINATSASLTADKMVLPSFLLKSTTLCYDLAYSKIGPTPFVIWASEHGIQGVDGLGMLVEQAAESFYLWYGIRPQARPVLEELRQKQ
jgi:shikimate dehydrogenase